MPSDDLKNLSIALANNQPTTANEMSTDNNITNSMVDSGILPESQRENVPQTITTDALAGEQALDIPDPDINNREAEAFANELSNDITARSAIADLQTEQQKELEAQRKATKASEDDYINYILTAPTLSDFEMQAAEQFGFDEKNLIVKNLDHKLLSMQDQLRTQIEKIEQGGGGWKIGAQSEIANLERESLAKQADVALLRMDAQNQLEYASAQMERVANAMWDRQKQITEYRRTLINRNWDLFDEQERRAANLALENAERQDDIAREDFLNIQSVKTEAMKMANLNVAPQEVLEAIANAQDIEEVISVGGQYGVADMVMRGLQQEQMRASIANSWANKNLADMKMQAERDAQKKLQEAIDRGDLILDDTQRGNAYKLKQDFEKESAEFKKQIGAYNRILASGTDPSAAGDLALIFNYMKLLDPGSVVREGEFANAQNAGGVGAKIQARYNNVLRGERLTETQRADFLDRSQKLYDTALEQQVLLEERFTETGEGIFSLPPEAVDFVIQPIRAAGTTSEVAFGIQLDNMSAEQRAQLTQEGLLPTSTGAVITQ